MYNENSKLKFIKEQYPGDSSTAIFAKRLLKACGKYEREWGCDICTKSTEEVTPVLEEITGLRNASKWARMNVLRNYARWCIENNVPGACDGILNAKCDGIDKVRKQMVRDPDHLQRVLDSVFKDEYECTIENIYRCYCWMVYSGIDGDTVFTVETSNVKLDSMEICLDDKTVKIYDQARRALHSAAYATEFQWVASSSKDGIAKPRKRAPGTLILRGFRGDVTPLVMRAQLSRSVKLAYEGKDDKVEISYMRLRLSGIFYRIYEREIATGEVDFSEVVDEFMNGREYNLSSGRNTIEAKRRRIEKEYMLDYQMWKTAFYEVETSSENA